MMKNIFKAAVVVTEFIILSILPGIVLFVVSAINQKEKETNK